jgi:hypothetical protein
MSVVVIYKKNKNSDKSYMNVRGEQRAIDESSLPGYMRGVSQKA